MTSFEEMKSCRRGHFLILMRRRRVCVCVFVRFSACVGVRVRVAALLDISVYMYLGSGRRRGVFRLISFLYFAHQCPDLYIVYVCTYKSHGGLKSVRNHFFFDVIAWGKMKKYVK
jgi:hypothetical protein